MWGMNISVQYLMKAIQEIIASKEKVASQQFKGLSIDASSAVKIIPEQVFTNETKDAETLSKLKQSLVAKSDAFTLLVNHKPVVSLKNTEAYEKTVQMLKLQYVSQQELDNLSKTNKLAIIYQNYKMVNLDF